MTTENRCRAIIGEKWVGTSLYVFECFQPWPCPRHPCIKGCVEKGPHTSCCTTVSADLPEEPNDGP